MDNNFEEVLNATMKYYQETMIKRMGEAIYGLPKQSRVKINLLDRFKNKVAYLFHEMRLSLAEKIAGQSFDDYDY